MIKTFKYKLRLTKSQESTLNQWLGTCRFVYNNALEHRKLHYQSTGKGVNYYDQASELKQIKQTDGLEWIGLVPSQSLQDVLERLDKAYKSFFKGGGFPKWAKKDKYNSITFKSIKEHTHNRFKVPKLGSVKYFASRKIEGKLKRATITKEGNSWFICVMSEVEQPKYIPSIEKQDIGLDWGVSHFFTLSNGHHEPNLRLTDKYKDRLRVLQRSLARKKKGSHNWRNIKGQINRLYSKIARVRKDWQHKLSSDLVRRFDSIFVEDLKIKNITKSSKGNAEDYGKNVAQKSGLNRSILDTAPSQFFNFIEYKCDWYGRNFEKVTARNTSRECSMCGHTSKDNRKTQSKFKCVNCGHSENADKNASKNIKSRGYTALAVNVGH